MERLLPIALGILLGLVIVSSAHAQQAQVDAGAKLFTSACRVCHGEAGVGNRAPALRGPRLTADYVSRTIVEGKAGTMMPKFGTAFTPQQVNQLASYVVSLQSSDSVWLALRGNATAGEQVFFDREAAHSCHNCHTFQGKGARVGPELTAKLKGKSAREVFQKIVIVPHRSADPAYVNVAITTKSGERVTGIKAEENDTELHFYDTSILPPEVRTLPKAEIVSMKPLNGSAMPSDYASRLPLQKLLDLVAYLRTGVEGTPVSVSFEDVIQDRAPMKR
jgi:putative heme-binding domain-containing protein